MNFIYDKLISASSWSIQNTNNMYNLLFVVLDDIDEDYKRRKIITQVKIHCGMSFYNGFKDYCIKKLGMKHNIMELFD